MMNLECTPALNSSSEKMGLLKLQMNQNINSILSQTNLESWVSGLPDWLVDAKKNAWGVLRSKGLPKSSDEQWKYIPLESILEAQCKLDDVKYRVEGLEKNFQYQAWSDIDLEDLQLLKQTIVKIDFNRCDFFFLLNFVVSQKPLIIQIPENEFAQNEIAIKISGDSLQGQFCLPFIIVQSRKSSKAAVVIEVDEKSRSQGKFVSSYLFIAEEAADLNIIDKGMGSRNTVFAQSVAQIKSSSRLKYVHLNAASGIARHRVQAFLTEPNASLECTGLAILEGEERTHYSVDAYHEVQDCKSSQFYKSIVQEKGIFEFNSKVHAYRGAVGTSSSQLNHNLILSDDARAYSRPRLRIDEDDVECSHGATAGPLDENELHYLQTRGISLSQARDMMVKGFAREIIDCMPLRQHKEDLTNNFLLHINNLGKP